MTSFRELLPNASFIYEPDLDPTAATYFVFRPVCDGGDYTFTSDLVGDDSESVQIHMGFPTQPSTPVAKYWAGDLQKAFAEFTALSQFNVSLWYDGNELFTRFRDLDDLLWQLNEQRFDLDDEYEFKEMRTIFEAVGVAGDAPLAAGGQAVKQWLKSRCAGPQT